MDEVIERVQISRLIQVRGTPASGKTTLMELVANKLFQRHNRTIPIYNLSGWNRVEVEKAGNWGRYLGQQTGVSGSNWLGYSAYLLIDEAQRSYWDDALWADFFKKIQEYKGNPLVILFTSFGSPGIGYEGHYLEEDKPTPLKFSPEQQISIRPDESLDYSQSFLRTSNDGVVEFCYFRPVGLLLEEDEAIDIVTRYEKDGIYPSLSLSADLKKGLFLISDGHVGLLMALLSVLLKPVVSFPL